MHVLLAIATAQEMPTHTIYLSTYKTFMSAIQFSELQNAKCPDVVNSQK